MPEPQDVSHDAEPSRRRFLKQAATVAWAAPLIVTMTSRAANAQAPTQCGTLQLFSMPGGGSQLRCNVTNPCGSTQQCVPTGFLNPGDPCFCIP